VTRLTRVLDPHDIADPLDALRAESAWYGYGLRIGADGASFVPPERCLLAIGPPRSGKTSAVVIPNVLCAGGAVVTTSTKTDVVIATAAARSRVGRCMLFDPSGAAGDVPGVERVGWSPLASSLDWHGATVMAETMVRTARPAADRGEAAHWNERAQALLAPAFHAAALDGMGMGRLLAAIDRRQGSQLRAVLARHDKALPLDTLESILVTDEREQSGIWSTASSILAAYRSDRALECASLEGVDFEGLVRGGDTLYVCSQSEDQHRTAPLVGGLLRDARAAAYLAASAGDLGAASRKPPLLLVLDEVANIAPIHDLPALASEGGSRGVVTLACLQDLSQAVDRWGTLGEGFLGIFNTKVVFPGVGDTRTLEAVSKLAGHHDITAISTSEGHRMAGLAGLLGRREPSRRTVSTRREPRLPIDRIAQGEPGHVVCIDGATPSFVRASPWFASPAMREVVEQRVAGREAARGAARGFARDTARNPTTPSRGLGREW
jgi:type IV secretion system protein VirD4